jgi:hypothetical protein
MGRFYPAVAVLSRKATSFRRPISSLRFALHSLRRTMSAPHSAGLARLELGLPMKLIFFSVGAASCRDDRGWKPLPQKQFFVIDRMAPDAEVRAKGVNHEICRG